MFTHILLEVYCGKKDNLLLGKEPFACVSEDCVPIYECLINKCPYVSFTTHENALCYVNDRSEANDLISLGGEMLPNYVDKQAAIRLWKKISQNKILEAYEQYMSSINRTNKTGDG